ncbi:MAG TPA: tetratricopeptide repeat protein [Candidatus Obscuribacterales bacterium]
MPTLTADQTCSSTVHVRCCQILDKVWHTYMTLGLNALKEGDAALARTMLEAALEEATSRGKASSKIAASTTYLARAYRCLHRHEEAKTLYLKSWSLLRNDSDADQFLFMEVLDALAEIHVAAKDFRIAKRFLTKAIKVREELYGSDHPSLSQRLMLLGFVHTKLNAFDDAFKSYNRAKAIRQKLSRQ